MKFLLIMFALSAVAIAIGSIQNIDKENESSVNEFDALFTVISSDSLHVFPNGNLQGNNHKEWLGEYIPRNLIRSYNLNPDESIALGKIYFDTKKEMIGYLIGNTSESAVFLYIYSKEKKRSIFNMTIASSASIEGAYEEIINSWITDLDNNGSLDIAVWKRMTDFEFYNEHSANITKDERFSYINLGSHFEYDSWNTGILPNAALLDKNSFIITAIDAKLPLKLDKIDFNENIVHLNDGIVSTIKKTAKKYAYELTFYDSSQTYRDVYLNTIQLHDSLQTIYIVLLKHYPTNAVNSKVLFYDNQKKKFADKVVDFNLHALYDFDHEKLTPSNLKTDFKITSPEIEIVDFNKDGINDFKFTKLLHNGTFNALHTTVLTINNLRLETLLMEEIAIY